MSKTMGCDSRMDLAKKKGPMFFGVLPMKSVILFMQFLAILYQTYQSQDCFGCFISTVYFTRIIFIGVFLYCTFLYIYWTIGSEHVIRLEDVLQKAASNMTLDEKMSLENARDFSVNFFYTGVYYFCAFLACGIFYVWMCHKVINDLDTELKIDLSTSDTNECRSDDCNNKKLTKKCD